MHTPPCTDTLDDIDRLLLDRLHGDLPISHLPFEAVAAEAGLSQTEVLARLARLREIGAITRFGPFLDLDKAGGALCLCAMAVPEGDFERVVTFVNALPEVVLNHERAHRLNIWFVLACDTAQGIARAAARIERETGITVLRFPKEKEFFFGFRAAT